MTSFQSRLFTLFCLLVATRRRRDGGLSIDTPVGTVTDRPPVTYRQIDDRRVDIASRFVMHDGEIGFGIGRYDTSQPSAIDPTIVYSIVPR